MDTPKRRLPVLNAAPLDEGSPRRPWQWVGFGVVAIFTAWVPLAALATLAAARIAGGASGRAALAAGAGTAAVFALALGLGAALGGALVGRWGPAGVGVREAALAGLGAALLAGALTWLTLGPSIGVLFLAAVAVPAAAAGGRAGARRR